MIKTTLTKLKKAYSTLSFAPRALGVDTNGKFYKLIVTLLRRADKRTKPDKTEEEEYERGEVIAKLMLAPSDTAALYSRGLSKPEAYQKSSFLAPPVDKQREKSTFSKKDDSQQNELNNPQCDLQEVAESMPKPVPHSMIQTETQVNKASELDTETSKQATFFVETKKIDPPNSLQYAIPDITLDKNNIDCPDGKTGDPNILCSPEKENSYANKLNNLQNNIRHDKLNNMLISEHSSYIRSRLLNKDNDSPSIKFFASYDKTKKPPSTETNSTFDELAKHCLDSPNNKIDERLLKEMKKLGVPQTSPRSENSVIEGNIIQMDVLRKPRKPAEKTEIDVETRKFEHPPLNYSDEQRLEFEPSTAEEKELEAIQKKGQDILVLTPQLCNLKSPSVIDGDKPLLNPFDKRKIKFDDDGNNDFKDGENFYHTNGPETVQLENTNENLKSFRFNSQNIDKPLEIHKLSENETNNEKSLQNPSNPPKLSMVSEDSVDSANSTAFTKLNAVDFQPKSEQESTRQSKDISDKVKINSKNEITVDYQPEGELDFSKQSAKNADNVTTNYSPVNQDGVDCKLADEPKVLSKLPEDKVYTATIKCTPLTNGVDFQAEGELAYSKQSEKTTQNIAKRKPEKGRKLDNMFYDHIPKIPEPLLVFNPPEQRSAKLSVHANEIDLPRANEDLGTNQNVEFVQNLKSLRIRCNVLPTKNTDEKSTISLLVEIDAIKQPREEIAEQQQPDVTYREDSASQQQYGNRSTTYLKKMDHITRDKVTLILPAKEERTNEAEADSLPKEKPEIPLSEMLKRVRTRNQAEYCHQLEKNLEHELDTVVETVTGKCGDKKSSCPPPCPPPQKSRCPRPTPPPCGRPACPRPCKPAGPPSCPPRCPRPCGPSRRSGNPCCPGSGSSKKRKGGNPCCPGASSSSKGKGNPCCPGSSSSSGRRCKFSMHLPTIMMNSFVSLIHQRVTIAESELARNHFFMITKDAYQRFLGSAYFSEKYSPHLLPILSMCGFDTSLGNFESMNSMLARDYHPWVPIPCWPEPKKEAKKPLPCPKGCQIPLPGKLRPPCNPYPCRGFPKRKNSFSIIDLYACWSNPNGRQ